MDLNLGIKQSFKIATTLRKLADRYKGSRNPYDIKQGETLDNMANDIIGNKINDAQLRFDSLHANIRKALPFDVLDHIDRAEHHVKHH